MLEEGDVHIGMKYRVVQITFNKITFFVYSKLRETIHKLVFASCSSAKIKLANEDQAQDEMYIKINLL